MFLGQKSVFCCHCIQNVKDGVQIQVFNIINDSVNHCRQFISVKVKKNLRKSQAQFWEKLRKLRLRQNIGFLIKKCVFTVIQKKFLWILMFLEDVIFKAELQFLWVIITHLCAFPCKALLFFL